MTQIIFMDDDSNETYRALKANENEKPPVEYVTVTSCHYAPDGTFLRKSTKKVEAGKYYNDNPAAKLHRDAAR